MSANVPTVASSSTSPARPAKRKSFGRSGGSSSTLAVTAVDICVRNTIQFYFANLAAISVTVMDRGDNAFSTSVVSAILFCVRHAERAKDACASHRSVSLKIPRGSLSVAVIIHLIIYRTWGLTHPASPSPPRHQAASPRALRRQAAKAPLRPDRRTRLDLQYQTSNPRPPHRWAKNCSPSQCPRSSLIVCSFCRRQHHLSGSLRQRPRASLILCIKTKS